MQTIKLQIHGGEDGLLKVEVPSGMTNTDLEVLLIMQPLETTTPEALGWPPRFFERTFGSLRDLEMELTREPQGEYGERDTIP